MKTNSSWEQLAIDMFNAKQVSVNLEERFEFKLHEKYPSAPHSPIKIELRTPDHPSSPGTMKVEMTRRIAKHLLEQAKLLNLSFDAVAGVPYAGNPIARAFAAFGDFPIMTLEKAIRKDGTRKISGIIDHGEAEPGDTVLLIENVISTAESICEALGVLRENRYVVHNALAVVDWELGGTERLSQEHVSVYCLFHTERLLALWKEHGKVSAEVMKEAVLFRAATHEMVLGNERRSP